MNKVIEKIIKKKRRQRRVRKAVTGSGSRPRLSVFRSNRHIYGQLIDDVKKTTLVFISDFEVNGKKLKKFDLAKETGKLLAKKALAAKIDKVSFDRGAYKYHGRLKAFAEGAREGGLQF